MNVTNPDMRFVTEADVIRSIEKLRLGYEQDGQWTLAQTCWHLDRPIAAFLRQSDRLEPTDKEKQMRVWLDETIAAGGMADGLPAPPETVPPADVPESAIDDLISDLRTLSAAECTHVNFGPFGPVPLARFREFNIVHAAHHLKRLRATFSKHVL